MSLLPLLYGGHSKGRSGIFGRVDVLLDQHPAWFWLADSLAKSEFCAERLDFEANDCVFTIASLLDLEIIDALFRHDVGVSVTIISDRGIDIFWACVEYCCRLHIDLSHMYVPFCISF